jgi:hypothetical protein
VNNLPYFGADSDGEINVNGTSTVTNKGIFNVGYSIPLTNASYFKMATPCVHAGACPERTCGVCIGNTYDYDSLSPTYGYPICSGASFTYTADSVAKKTIQSPILTVDMPYSAKLMPYKIYDGVSENSVIDTNRLALYDKENNTNPIFFDVNFYSASSTRGDIVWIYDTAGISEANNNKKYLMLSSQYGLSDFMWDMSAFTRGF